MHAQADVLIVDDDRDLREAVGAILHAAGYNVRCAENGREGLDAVAQRTPAVVLLDIHMPVMNGCECARELRSRYGRAVAIVIVSAAARRVPVCLQGVSVDDVLPKPFEMDDLLDVVARFAPHTGASPHVTPEGWNRPR